MKKTFLILLTIFSMSLSKAENILTAQVPDIITFEGTEYSLNSNPLEPFFELNPDRRPQGGMITTALWRGYVAYFEIIDDQLYVTDVEILVRDENIKDSNPYKWISVYKEVFPNSEKTKIDWFTGILILPHGEMVEYVHMGYASTYTDYWLLEIEKGTFNEARKYKNTEFVQFKKRQFEAFKKTDTYKKMYSEIRAGDVDVDDTFINSFISDFVINYTTKFLTD